MSRMLLPSELHRHLIRPISTDILIRTDTALTFSPNLDDEILLADYIQRVKKKMDFLEKKWTNFIYHAFRSFQIANLNQ